jgi:beta-fructofuranosidase
MGELNKKLESKIMNISCPLRPKYHFMAPSKWMNDPNGPIIYKGQYHLFYQWNPTGEQWGNIHWGHAKSKDLVYWEHLPLALAPSHDKGEIHCFSGCCVLNNGVPTIIYTSIGPENNPATGAELWVATSDNEMISWKKYDNNPVMTKSLNEGLEIHDWRDPFVWKEEGIWYLILGGHIKKPVQPLVLLYKSHDLYNWKFVGPLIIEDKSKGKNWECPNFFKLEGKYVLIVSPHRRVLYSIGCYGDSEFTANEWNILDHGKLFYATNVMKDNNNRVLLWAWIKSKGMKYWNGCLTLPRILNSIKGNKLTYQFPKELKKLRQKQFLIENAIIDNQKVIYPFKFKHFCFEIKAELQLFESELFFIKLTDNKSLSESETIGYNLKNKIFWAGKDKAHFIPPNDKQYLKLHIYIDISIVEVIINNQECITTQIIPPNCFSNQLEIVVLDGKLKVNKLCVWNLKPIW